ncbi:MAG TPA: sugar ABC transporter permease [Firmicutes bacterium]|nr:sugar ABC transporter permease [Bacillota bacterium]
MKTISKQKNSVLFVFLFLPISLMLLFVLFPTIEMFRISFTSWDGLSKTQELVGLTNYKEILTNSPEVWLSLRNNAIYFFVHAFFIPIELIIAAILDRKIRGSKFFKTVIFMPYIINGVAIAYTFSFFFSPINGALNGILEKIGLGMLIRNWLTDVRIVNLTLAGVSLWRFSGVHVILFLAGIQSIHTELLESAMIDGANAWQKFRFIIVPGVRRVLEVILFLNLRGALQVFDIPFIMTNGGPGHASSTFTTYTLETAFKFSSYGTASAMGVSLICLIILLNWIQNKVFNIKGVGFTNENNS